MERDIGGKTFLAWRKAVRKDLEENCKAFYYYGRKSLFKGLIETAWIGEHKTKDNQRFIINPRTSKII